MSRTLVITNDFPPRSGGIQTFIHELAVRQPPDSIVVFASDHVGSSALDAAQPFEVIRYPHYPMLPTPRVARQAASIARSRGCDTAWFGAAAPLGLLAPTLRRAGVNWCVAQTHGHEVGWARLPGARMLLRRIAGQVDVLTYLGEYTRRRLEPVVGNRTALAWLPPGVDVQRFHPGVDGAAVRARYHLTGRPVVVCVSRLVPRKGHDALIRALPLIHRRMPQTALLLVGGGPDERRLRRLATRSGVESDVVFAGQVPAAELAQHYAAGDLFAMPCRTRRAGLDVEGLGMVYLEASAMGLPVIAGDSGGAPDAVRNGETGYILNGRSISALADSVVELLGDQVLAQQFGAAGRAWVEQQWRWEVLADRMGQLLQRPSPVEQSRKT